MPYFAVVVAFSFRLGFAIVAGSVEIYRACVVAVQSLISLVVISSRGSIVLSLPPFVRLGRLPYSVTLTLLSSFV